MPIRPAFWNYDDTRDGQVAVGTVTSSWFDVQGLATVNLRGAFTNSTGATQVFLDYSNDAQAVASSSANVAASLGGAGVEVSVPLKYVRVRIVQTTAATTAAQLGASAHGTVFAVETHN